MLKASGRTIACIYIHFRMDVHLTWILEISLYMWLPYALALCVAHCSGSHLCARSFPRLCESARLIAFPSLYSDWVVQSVVVVAVSLVHLVNRIFFACPIIIIIHTLSVRRSRLSNTLGPMATITHTIERARTNRVINRSKKKKQPASTTNPKLYTIRLLKCIYNGKWIANLG